MRDGWVSHLPAALQLCVASILFCGWNHQLNASEGLSPEGPGRSPPPPTTQAATRVYPRACGDLLRNNMLFFAGSQPGGTGSPCCPHEGRSHLTIEHTWQKARNEVRGLP